MEVARGSSEQTCPVQALGQWLHFARIDFGPIFVAVSRDGTRATADRLSDKHVARLIKQTVLDAGIRPDLPEAERARLYSGHSLRAGLASSAEMTRRYQRRRDRQVPGEPDQGRGAVRAPALLAELLSVTRPSGTASGSSYCPAD